jgi:hypothetical protein
VRTVKVMSADELRNLARIYDGPAAIDSDKRGRAALDAAAQRYGVQAHTETDVKDDRHTTQIGKRGGRQVDGDNLSPHEGKTLETMRAILETKYAPEFVSATMHELESRIRSQRVHIGTVVDHGEANYRWDKDKSPSYYVTLRTVAGQETIWGKNLKTALEDGRIKVGDQVVLTNVGKKPVEVTERVRDERGRLYQVPKSSELNGWTAQTIDRFSSGELGDLGSRANRGQPTMRVYDVAAARTPAPAVERNPIPREPNRDIGSRDIRDR